MHRLKSDLRGGQSRIIDQSIDLSCLNPDAVIRFHKRVRLVLRGVMVRFKLKQVDWQARRRVVATNAVVRTMGIPGQLRRREGTRTLGYPDFRVELSSALEAGQCWRDVEIVQPRSQSLQVSGFWRSVAMDRPRRERVRELIQTLQAVQTQVHDLSIEEGEVRKPVSSFEGFRFPRSCI